VCSFHLQSAFLINSSIPIISLPATHPSGEPAREVQDWDCVESLDLPLFESTLRHIKAHGQLPPDSFSKEDQNSVGQSSVPQSLVDAQHAAVESWLSLLPSSVLAENTCLHICLLDGFLLYPAPTAKGPMHTLRTLSELFDMKIFTPCSRAQTIERRTKRTGYVTLEGFWADPPGYVEDVVWPNFMRDHEYLCKQEGPDGTLIVDQDVLEKEQIFLAPGNGDAKMEELIEWAVGLIEQEVRAR
jgi:nicotinamide/nicotinate riboside kinase